MCKTGVAAETHRCLTAFFPSVEWLATQLAAPAGYGCGASVSLGTLVGELRRGASSPHRSGRLSSVVLCAVVDESGFGTKRAYR